MYLMQTNPSWKCLILCTGLKGLVCDRPHTSTMDLSQAAPRFARLCHPHGNYYLVTFLSAVVGGRRSFFY